MNRSKSFLGAMFAATSTALISGMYISSSENTYSKLWQSNKSRKLLTDSDKRVLRVAEEKRQAKKNPLTENTKRISC